MKFILVIEYTKSTPVLVAFDSREECERFIADNYSDYWKRLSIHQLSPTLGGYFEVYRETLIDDL